MVNVALELKLPISRLAREGLVACVAKDTVVSSTAGLVAF